MKKLKNLSDGSGRKIIPVSVFKRKMKRQQYITKQTAYYAAAFALGGIVFVALTWFLGNYRLQSPVIFQSPFVSRYISPLPDSKTAKPVVLPLNGSEDKAKEKVEGTKASPSPTPRPKRTLVPVVEAAEINTDNNPVKEYIVEKFGEDAPIMLKIAQCESGTQAYNWYNKWLGASRETADAEGYAVGVFMVYRKVHAHLSFDDMLDYKKNTDYAYGLFKANGTNPWNASKHCWNK